MPFRCKCGRTFEKLESFGSHTTGCAPFHHRRISTSDVLASKNEIRATEKAKLSIETNNFSQQSQDKAQTRGDGALSFFPLFIKTSSKNIEPAPRSAPVSGFMMPTALSIQNTFEGVSRRRSMSYKATSM
ncbi:hypothetical protein V8B55DRAFT_1499901 [Mucor lusitanicus]|uniref:Uncharacterized protein n=1 Tax=Mucor circinelloides f. lusitanicus TaxID=29924 RepID=A0A8H4BNB5_MUCCL|nr:hypothetical protein FB192DRAFT_1357963 [Mucor lusitanicus]